MQPRISNKQKKQKKNGYLTDLTRIPCQIIWESWSLSFHFTKMLRCVTRSIYPTGMGSSTTWQNMWTCTFLSRPKQSTCSFFITQSESHLPAGSAHNAINLTCYRMLHVQPCGQFHTIVILKVRVFDYFIHFPKETTQIVLLGGKERNHICQKPVEKKTGRPTAYPNWL